jgi:hypothetical protein
VLTVYVPPSASVMASAVCVAPVEFHTDRFDEVPETFTCTAVGDPFQPERIEIAWKSRRVM